MAGSLADASRKRRNLFEFAVVLLQFVPATLLSFFAVEQDEATSFTLVAAGTILKDVTLVALILFLIWRAREPVRWLGLHARHAGREVAVGLALFLPVSVLASLAASVVSEAGLPGPSAPASLLQPKSPGEIVLGLLMVVVVAVTEELIFRGYFLLRFSDLSRSRGLAILASAVFFGLGHGYEGWTGVTATGVMGAALAGIYLWRGSLVAPIVIHFMQDFVAMILIPAFTGPTGG